MEQIERRIDEEGRVTIPQELRETLDIEPGDRVILSVKNGQIIVRPSTSRDEFLEQIAGVVSTEARADDAAPPDPGTLKDDWVTDPVE